MKFNFDADHVVQHFKEHTFKDTIYLLLFILLIVLPIYVHYFFFKEISGIPQEIMDSHSFKLANKKILLRDIKPLEASYTCYIPEENQLLSCPKIAQDFLNHLINNKNVVCKWQNRNKQNFLVSYCYVGGQDIAAKMIELGYALSTNTTYGKEQDTAKENKKGFWYNH